MSISFTLDDRSSDHAFDSITRRPSYYRVFDLNHKVSDRITPVMQYRNVLERTIWPSCHDVPQSRYYMASQRIFASQISLRVSDSEAEVAVGQGGHLRWPSHQNCPLVPHLVVSRIVFSAVRPLDKLENKLSIFPMRWQDSELPP